MTITRKIMTMTASTSKGEYEIQKAKKKIYLWIFMVLNSAQWLNKLFPQEYIHHKIAGAATTKTTFYNIKNVYVSVSGSKSNNNNFT